MRAETGERGGVGWQEEASERSIPPQTREEK